jgi:aldose sugar dehydrogenase
MRLLVFLVLGALLAGCTASTTENIVRGTNDGGSQFLPRELTVASGSKVTFVMGTGSHTVDFAEGQAPVEGVSNAHSGNLDPGQSFEVTFTKPGKYPYYCLYHSSVTGQGRTGMVGTITVT